MGIFEAILLGIIQGLTEFLPISSSAHLRIASELVGIGDAGAAFTAITQLGTEAAVVVFFWRDIVRIIGRWFRSLSGAVPRRDPDALMGWWIILGTIPIVVLGLLFEGLIDTTLRSLWFVAIALIPGVSRSGGTITAGLLMGYTREAAARYSFLLAIPAVFGSGGYKLIKSIGDPGSTAAVPTLLATVIAFVVALVVIGVFMRYISHGSFMPFVVYRVLLGVVIIVLLSTGVLTAEGGVSTAQVFDGSVTTLEWIAQ